MRFLKRFVKFNEEFVMGGQEVETKPAPTTTPGVKPTTRPSRPSPIRRDKPSVEPDPKMEIDLPKATAEEVVDRFVSLLNDRGEDIKKYIER